MNLIVLYLLLGLSALGITATTAYLKGEAHASAQCQADAAASVARAIAQEDARAREDAAILRASEARQAKRRAHVIYRTREATRHVSTHPDLYGQRLDACGVCLATSAATDGDPAACPCHAHGPAATADKTAAGHDRR